jgi:hypothetical protein
VKTNRPDPFSAPKWLYPLALAAMSLHLGAVIGQALNGNSVPTGIQIILGVVQFVWFLAVPLAAGVWWGRGRPGVQTK